MSPFPGFRGTDAARLDDLAWRAAEAAARTAQARAAIRSTGASGTEPADATLQQLQDWLHGVVDDARRRAAVTRGALPPMSGTLTAGLGAGVGMGAVGPPGAAGGADGPGSHPLIGPPAPPPTVTHSTSAPVLHEDGATGLHLQGYAGVGLAWRHIGTETRTVSTITDYGGGWVRIEDVHEKRAVFDVEVGAGIGPKRLGGLGDHRYHDRWIAKKPKVRYLEDGRPVDPATFQWATGAR